MIKKVFSFLIFLCCSFLLAGCNEVQDLSEEETKLIAEYAAEQLLKYDVNYNNRIEDGNKEASEMTTEATTQELTTQENLTTEKKTTEQLTENVSSKEDENKVETPTNVQVGNEKDIAKIAGIQGATILYQDYLITEQYPTVDKEGVVVNITASEGYELLILRFKVTNVTEEPVNVSLIDKQIDYDVICNENKAANPMLTILLDDLETFDMLVNPEKEEEAVLIFQISKQMKEDLKSIQLKVHYEDKDNRIKIL